MKDRLPTKPNRVKITHENGSTEYATIVRADEPTEVGTPLSKATLLTDETASKFDLTNATPEDVFSWLGQYNLHWWSRKSFEDVPIFSNKALAMNSSIIIASRYSSSPDLYYSSEYEIGDDDNIRLVNPIKIQPQSSSLYIGNDLVSHAPCYIFSTSDEANGRVFFLPSGATSGTSNSSTLYTNSSGDYLRISSSAGVKSTILTYVYERQYGDAEYLSAKDRNAYPDGAVGKHSGLFYVYLGVPFEHTINPSRVVAGSYVGTGEYGASAPNKLVFTGKPVLFAFLGEFCGTYGEHTFWDAKSTRGYYPNQSSSSFWCTVSWGENSIEWYSEGGLSGSADAQRNVAGTEYQYIAFLA